MKKITLIIIDLFFLASLCFAENYYSRNYFLIDSQGPKDGNMPYLEVITKAFDKTSAWNVFTAKTEGRQKPIGEWTISMGGSCCIKGSDIFDFDNNTTWDDFLGCMFNNQPSKGSDTYISFTDLDGYQTVLRFLAQYKISLPHRPAGLAAVLPEEVFSPMTENLLEFLKNSGINDAKIIYPEKSEERDMTYTIQATAGKEFVITLYANATTGYEWKIVDPIDNKLIRLVRSEYMPYKTQAVGSGGKSVWTFKAVAAGMTQISFKYIRTWEKNVPPAKALTYIINIQEKIPFRGYSERVVKTP